MMKKTILYSLLILSTGLFNSACTDVKEYEDGRISYKEIFQNDKKTAGYLNLCYSCIESFGMQYGGGSTLLAGFSDEAHDANDIYNGSALAWANGGLTTYNNPISNSWWTNYWAGIRYCNVFLENIDNAQVSLERNRISWRAQAYTLRAYYYLQLIKRFGGVPIATKPYPMGYDYSQLKKTSFSECVKQIIADCDEALKADNAAFGWRAGNVESDRGKFSKAVACAVKSQAALYAASPLWNDGTFTWKDAAKITSEALAACLEGGYKLYTTVPDPTVAHSAYDAYFFSRSDMIGANDKETIYESTSQLSLFKYSGLPITSGSLSSGVCPSQELVDSYEMSDGTVPILGYKDADHLEPIINPNSSYNPDYPYYKRDPRLTASIYYNGSYYSLKDKNKVWICGDDGGYVYPCEISATDPRKTRTGYYIRKYANFTSHETSAEKVNNDGYFKIYRLAELYLNAAEALNEAVGTGNAPKEALDAINAVRDRAGMPHLEAGISCDDFRSRVRNERRVELAFEEARFYDVRRWKLLSQTDRVVTGMNLLWRNGSGDYLITRFVVRGKRSAYADKYLIFPIPADEAIRLQDATGVSFQNPGW